MQIFQAKMFRCAVPIIETRKRLSGSAHPQSTNPNPCHGDKARNFQTVAVKLVGCDIPSRFQPSERGVMVPIRKFWSISVVSPTLRSQDLWSRTRTYSRRRFDNLFRVSSIHVLNIRVDVQECRFLRLRGQVIGKTLRFPKTAA